MLAPRRLATLFCAAALLAGCSGDDGAGDLSVASTTTTTLVAGTAGATTVEVAEGPHSVLTAVVDVVSDTPVRPRVVARAAGGHTVVVPPPADPATELTIPLVGLRAETEYAVRVEGSPGLRTASRRLRFTTGALPGDLPDLTVSATARARPGVTLFNAGAGVDDLPLSGSLLAVDQDGQVVWYHQAEQSIADVRQLPSGNLIFNYGNIGAREIDVLGDVVREWTTRNRVRFGQVDSLDRDTYGDGAVVLETPRLHHEVADLLPNGNFLALGMEIRPVDGFPADLCPVDPLPPGPRPIRGDVILEFTPEGEIVHRISLLDSIDPVAQPGLKMCEVKTDQLAYGNRPFVDWSHANSAEVFEDENVVLVSARNLSSVMALRWRRDPEGPAGEVLWQLGPGQDFRLTEGEWFHQQHAPEVQADGTVLIYDNGTERPGTVPAGGTTLPYSRAVVYALDHDGPRATWTARQVWEHRSTEPGGEPTYADFLGDADHIGGGHILICHGAVADPSTGDFYSARLLEVDRASGATVLDIRLLAGAEYGWRSYRAEHLDTWYPRGAAAEVAIDDPPVP